MPPAPTATADPQVTPTSMPSPVMAPVAKPVAPVAQAKPIATPAPVAQPKPIASPISTTSMPSPQMIPSSTPAPKTPDISGYIKAAQAQGISSDDIYAHLKQLGYVDSTGAISNTKQATPTNSGTVTSAGTDINSSAAQEAQANVRNIPNKIGQTFEQGGKNVENDIGDMPNQAKNAGGSPLADVAAEAQGAGHVAGDIAGTAGGILGDVLSPLLPDSVKSGIGDATKYVQDKVNAIPGMTPEIAKSLVDLFNTGTLAGGGAAEEAAPAAAEAAGEAGSKAISATADAATGIKNAVKDTAGNAINKVRDVVTPEPPKTMQSIIERVKSDPVQAKNTADLVKQYNETAKNAVKNGGEDTATKSAGHAQFGKAMSVLSKNLKESGSRMNEALKSVGNAKVSGVGEVLDNLKAQTADRIGAEYTPLSDEDVRDSMKDMTPSQRYQYLNDMIDGKVGNPGEAGAFKPTEESGGQMSVKDGPSLKKLADLHETLNNLGDNPSVQAIHNVIQRWQEDLYKTDKPGKVEGIMRNIIGQLNEKVKGATAKIDGGKYADAKADYARQSQIKENAEGLLGDDMKHSGTVMKRLALNNVTGNVNKYVKDLEGETGVPIIDHATIANFADRLANNPQAQSLLESKMGSAHKIEGLWKAIQDFDLTKPVGSAANVVRGAGKALSDPEGKIMRQLGQNNKPSIIPK